ncbi:MAG: PEP-CTERM sorting domain-containing protein [Gammaproteobacteria bacterium]
MNIKQLTGTLAAALAVSHAQANPLALDNAIISASYNGQAAAMLGLDHQFALEPGSNVSALDPTDSGVEFLSADALFGFDFARDGKLTVYNNDLIAPGVYSARFDFGATLTQAITSFTLIESSAIAGLPILSFIDSHTIGLDLSNVSWNAPFVSFTGQIGLAQDADVPEPGGAALLAAGALGMALVRRRSVVR